MMRLGNKIFKMKDQSVPHGAVAEVSKIGKLQERFVVLRHGWQSKATDGSKIGWRQTVSL